MQQTPPSSSKPAPPADSHGAPQVDDGSDASKGCVYGQLGDSLGAPPTGLRVIISGQGSRREQAVTRGRFMVRGLRPGRYRVELVGPRLVIARRVTVPKHHGLRVDFN